MEKNKQKMLLRPQAILKYLKGDEKLHTLITAQNTEVDLITTDQNLYEALGSVENRSEINLNLLVKMLEVTTIHHHKDMLKEERKILTPERVEEIKKDIENEK
jgi:hypothetical protein